MSDRVRDFFEKYADRFNAIYGTRSGLVAGVVNRLFRRSMKLRFVRTIQECQPIEGRSVLDVGCGPGHYCIALARGGAARTVGIDVAKRMLEIARQHACAAGVSDRCEFHCQDFYEFEARQRYDYVIVIGFMDYVAQPNVVVRKALSLASSKAVFSFPADGGILAWQRKKRYAGRCDLFMYTKNEIEGLFARFPEVRVTMERISRDFFVTATVVGSSDHTSRSYLDLEPRS